MAYSKFSLKDIKEQFGIQLIEDKKLFSPETVQSAAISDYLKKTLEECVPLALAINTEKSRSEWIIAPILAELRKQVKHRISLFSGSTFTVDEEKGLDGQCDYIISLSPEQFYITAPLIIIAEAKKEDIIKGLGQCISAMYAADIFNKNEKNPMISIFGAVTSGTIWKFIKLTENKAYIDRDEYYLKEIEFIMGILLSIVVSDEKTAGEEKQCAES
jgi:hypothetical protein